MDVAGSLASEIGAGTETPVALADRTVVTLDRSCESAVNRTRTRHGSLEHPSRQSIRQRGQIDVDLYASRDADPEALAAEFFGPKGRGWLMRWLPARAHDNGLLMVFSNGVGRDDDEVRTGNAMILDPYGRIIAENREIGDDMVVADLIASLRDHATGVR